MRFSAVLSNFNAKFGSYYSQQSFGHFQISHSLIYLLLKGFRGELHLPKFKFWALTINCRERSLLQSTILLSKPKNLPAKDSENVPHKTNGNPTTSCQHWIIIDAKKQFLHREFHLFRRKKCFLNHPHNHRTIPTKSNVLIKFLILFYFILIYQNQHVKPIPLKFMLFSISSLKCQVYLVDIIISYI